MQGVALAALIARAGTPRQDWLVRDGEAHLSAAQVLHRVRALAAKLEGQAAVASIGLSGVDLMIADLASVWAGVRLVTLPTFFSPEQIAHCLATAGVAAVVLETPALSALLPPGFAGAVLDLDEEGATGRTPDPRPERHERIIFTSGTTGRPKGVRIGLRQLDWMTSALARAADAGADDVHVSALPQAQLLEQIAGLHVPLLAGARLCLDSQAIGRALAGDPAALFSAHAAWGATTTVLAPRLLAAWVRLLQTGTVRLPHRLRIVAVGGAPTAPGLVTEARALGLPVRVGYGLSECSSVVALGRAADPAGTVGSPLAGLTVTLEDGEIVVAGPTVMIGYLGEAPLPEPRWRTGDLGALDAEGRLFVTARRDTVIVASDGRNIAPEWVEAACETLPGVTRCITALADDGSLTAAVVLDQEVPAFAPEALHGLGLPGYALPTSVLVLATEDAAASGLLSPSRKTARTTLAALRRQAGGRFQPAA